MMNPTKSATITGFATLAALLTPTAAYAQSSAGSDLSPQTIIATILYGLIGVALCIVGYFLFDKLAGLNLRRELVEDQNIAIGIMLAGAFIGIAIVIAAVMLS
jgi:Domain of Unknown Function (DUF350)